MKTRRDQQLEKLAPNNIFKQENAIELASEFLEFEGMLFDEDGNEKETAEQVEKKAIDFLIAEGYELEA